MRQMGLAWFTSNSVASRLTILGFPISGRVTGGAIVELFGGEVRVNEANSQRDCRSYNGKLNWIEAGLLPGRTEETIRLLSAIAAIASGNE